MLEKNGQDFFCGINRLPDIDHLKKLIFHHLLIFQGRDPVLVGDRDMDKGLAYTLRDVLIEYCVITSYSIHYTKLYDNFCTCWLRRSFSLSSVPRFSISAT